MACINPSYGFINYSEIKNEASLNKILSTRTYKFSCNKKYSNIFEYFGKTCIGTVFYNHDEKSFKFPSNCLFNNVPDKLFSQFLTFIVHGEVSRFFIDSRFLEKFYKTYAKIYFSKMASTVRNYTVESISLKSTIFPFETAFTDFINHYSEFDDAINEITLNVLHLCTKRFISFNRYNIYEMNDYEKCDISVYDLFFRPNYVSEKLRKTFSFDNEFKFDKVPSSILVDDIGYNALKYYINHDVFEEIDLKENGVMASTLVYTIIKRSIRYAFVTQIKQSFGWFLDKNKEKYPEIKSIISDSNLYYTQNLINIKQNVKYLRNVITFCDSILSVKRNKKAIMNNSDNIKDFTQYVKSIVEHMRTHNNVAMNIMGDLKNLYVACFDKNQPQPVYTTEMYKRLKTISEYFCTRNETFLSNVQKYNFIDRWNEVIDEDLIINPNNYIEFRVIKEF